jgi:ribose transport system ATP-binding protein
MSDAHPQESSRAAVLEGRPPLLEMRHISKQYPGVKALDDVSFSLEHGEVHALLGENGAGKSTLIKILSGVTMADQGEIYIEGRSVVIDSPQKAMDLGISTIYQEFNLVPYLSAAENIFLGREPQGAVPGFVDFKTLYREAQQLMNRIRARFDVRTPVNQLSVAQQQMVEIAKALGRKTKILVMDEPTATLTEHEIDALFDLIRQLRSEGISVIYVSHRLEEIFEICDRATVLRDGRYVATKKVAELTREEIIRLMVGRELKEAIPKVAVPIGPSVLRVSHLNRKGVLHDISFEVHRGEIVGLAGLVGAGRTETARAIFGADPIDSGTIEIDGKPVRIRSPRDAIRAGIGLVTEDRKQQGLVLGMAVRSNNTLSNLQALSAAGFIRLAKERSVAEKYSQELSIKTPTIEQAVKNLSGGNQQKVVLAKWLFAGAKVLILDEPTRGIDVRAKSEIYELMNELASQGVGILMISSELPEILGMSDRILVMHEGRIVGELSREEATQEKIMHLATGGE